MTEWKRRTRVVSFRLSEEEHEELIGYCARQGVRSLSDFARLATLIQFESRNISQQPDTALQQIYRRLAALDREVERLARVVDERHSLTHDASSDAEDGEEPLQGYVAQEEINAA